jgi:hypothetical protein
MCDFLWGEAFLHKREQFPNRLAYCPLLIDTGSADHSLIRGTFILETANIMSYSDLRSCIVVCAQTQSTILYSYSMLRALQRVSICQCRYCILSREIRVGVFN